MHFIIQYSISSLILFHVVLLYSLRVKNFGTLKNQTFICYCSFGLVANALDIARCSLTFKPDPICPAVIILMNCLYYTAMCFLPLIYAIYCLAIVDYYHQPEKKNITFVHLSLIIPFLISIIYVWISPFFPDKKYSVFYILEGTNLINNGNYGYLVLYIIGMWFILSGLHVIVTFRKRIDENVLFHLIFAVVLMIGTLIAQRCFPYARVVFIGLSMSTLDCSFYIQKSEDIYDSKFGVLNKTGFKILLNHRFSGSTKFHIYYIVMDDAAFYRKALGKKERLNLENCILNSLKANFNTKGNSVFRFSYGNYAVVVPYKKRNNPDFVMKFIKDQIDLRWGFSSMDLAISFRVCEIESQIDVSSYREVSDLMDFFANNNKFKGGFLKANSMDLFRVHSHSYLETAIQKGLEKKRFEVYYQPIYSVKEQKLTAAEALIRLKDDDGNFVSPEEFIPIAEQNGTIFEIGKFVFENVCSSLSTLNFNDYNINKVDVNLSVIQCIQEDMYKQLISIRNHYHIPSNMINIEITETASTNYPDVLLKNMKLLEADGIELSMDDYGSGNSNIYNMLNLPFKMIKIDKFFVWKAFENDKARIALKSTIDMIKDLGFSVLAEGVETEEQSIYLQELGCDYLQGYFYSRPVAFEKFLEIMKK